MRNPGLVFSLLVLCGCAALQPDASNVAAYCTRDNGVRLGSQGMAYYGNCPKDRESAFRDGLAYGRSLVSTPSAWSYFERMRRTEDQLVAATSEAEKEPLRARLRELEFWTSRVFLRRGRS